MARMMTGKWTSSRQLQSHCLYMSLVLSFKDLDNSFRYAIQLLWIHVQILHISTSLKHFKSKCSGAGKTSKIQIYIYGHVSDTVSEVPVKIVLSNPTVWDNCILRSRMKGPFNIVIFWELRQDHCVRKSHLIDYNTCKDGKHSTKHKSRIDILKLVYTNQVVFMFLAFIVL